MLDLHRREREGRLAGERGFHRMTSLSVRKRLSARNTSFTIATDEPTAPRAQSPATVPHELIAPGRELSSHPGCRRRMAHLARVGALRALASRCSAREVERSPSIPGAR
jgi:hypothetical protein